MTEYSIPALLTLTIFGTLEVFASLTLAFTLFRINCRSYLKELIMLAALSSVISTFLLDIVYAPFVLNELVTLIVVMLCHIKWLHLSIGYSFLLTLAGYLLKELAVIAMSYLSLYAGFVPSLQSIMYEVPSTITVQFLTFATTVPISLYLYHQGVGFVFLTERVDFRTEYKRLNQVILSSIALSLIALEILFYYYFVREDVAFTAIAVGILVYITAMWSIYLRSNREMKEQVNQINVNDLFK